MNDLRIRWVTTSDDLVGVSALPGTGFDADTAVPMARDLDADLAQLSRYTSQLVILAEDHELAASGISDVVERALRYGLPVIRRPLKSRRSVPLWLLAEVAHWASHGPVVYASTTDGGRSALAAAAALVSRGLTVPEAANAVRAVVGGHALAHPANLAQLQELVTYRPRTEGTWWPGIPSAKLRRAHVPPPRVAWDPWLNYFALSFDGYGYAGDPDALYAIVVPEHYEASSELEDAVSLDDARACLFWLQRAVRRRRQEGDRDDDGGPYVDELRFAWALVERIREGSPLP